jgi:hypothetical protein
VLAAARTSYDEQFSKPSPGQYLGRLWPCIFTSQRSSFTMQAAAAFHGSTFGPVAAYRLAFHPTVAIENPVSWVRFATTDRDQPSEFLTRKINSILSSGND